MTIHWCGTGLSAGPGLRRLIGAGHDITVWEADPEKAAAVVGDPGVRIEPYDPETLAGSLAPQDIVVAMVPTALQMSLARIALSQQAHFVSSSYLTDEMRALGSEARMAGSALVSEVGLDPGIDHLMAHWLVADYRASTVFSAGNVMSFESFCGGIPKHPNAFRYKFSWSPAGVLNALRAPSRSIRDHTELRMARPWEALRSYTAPLPSPETFEVYPNRDSVPYIEEYGFAPSWKVRDFMRGTLRLNGWAEAWAGIFEELEALPEDGAEARIAEMSEELWAKNAYGRDEADRVVLCVSLKAEDEGRPVYHKTWALDAYGDARGSAMARLVSQTVSFAVEALIAHEIPPGVHSAPSDPKLVRRWLGETEHLAQYLAVTDHLKR